MGSWVRGGGDAVLMHNCPGFIHKALLQQLNHCRDEAVWHTSQRTAHAQPLPGCCPLRNSPNNYSAFNQPNLFKIQTSCLRAFELAGVGLLSHCWGVCAALGVNATLAGGGGECGQRGKAGTRASAESQGQERATVGASVPPLASTPPWWHGEGGGQRGKARAGAGAAGS